MRRFRCDVTEDAVESGHHEACLEPIFINLPLLWVVVSQAVTQLRFSPHLLAKFEDVVPHQGDLLCLRSGSEHDFFQNVLGRQRTKASRLCSMAFCRNCSGSSEFWASS